MTTNNKENNVNDMIDHFCAIAELRWYGVCPHCHRTDGCVAGDPNHIWFFCDLHNHIIWLDTTLRRSGITTRSWSRRPTRLSRRIGFTVSRMMATMMTRKTACSEARAAPIAK